MIKMDNYVRQFSIWFSIYRNREGWKSFICILVQKHVEPFLILIIICQELKQKAFICIFV